jgi:hypothetical protein
VIGAIATAVTGKQPGTLLGAAVVAGTVVAALAIQPRAGRMIFPAPALCYLIAALAAGAVYDRAADRTTLAIDAAQWIANGFYLMVLATVAAIAIVLARWLLRRRAGRGGPDWTRPPESGRLERGARTGSRDTDGPGPAGTQRMPRAPLFQETDQRTGSRPDQRSGRSTGPRPGARPGPYNFSSGA